MSVDVQHFTYGLSNGVYDAITINAGPTHVERIVPPAGEDHAFNVQRFRHQVHVSVSPTGRSIQVFIDGERVA